MMFSGLNGLSKVLMGCWSVNWSIPVMCLHRPDLDRDDRQTRAIDRDDRQTRAMMMHKDKRLNEALSKKIQTSTQFKTFCQQSYSAAKIESPYWN